MTKARGRKKLFDVREGLCGVGVGCCLCWGVVLRVCIGFVCSWGWGGGELVLCVSRIVIFPSDIYSLSREPGSSGKSSGNYRRRKGLSLEEKKGTGANSRF